MSSNFLFGNCDSLLGDQNHLQNIIVLTIIIYHNQYPEYGQKFCIITYFYSSLQKLVRSASVSGNLDAPEGGFDAIMQAIVCTKQIGWREKARRLLVFSTDASFHFAGDGKLGGIVKPNDGMCHLDPYSGMYTHSSIQDYPSIFQINQKVQQNAINIIWAVTKREMSTYSSLCSHIEGSSAGILSNDSSNIVELIKEQYNQIRSTVEIRDTVSLLSKSARDAIQIKYSSKCLDKNGALVQTNKCNKLQKGDKVEFIAEITATECPANKSEWNQRFMIYPVSIQRIPPLLVYRVIHIYFIIHLVYTDSLKKTKQQITTAKSCTLNSF